MEPTLYRGIAENEGTRWWDQGRHLIIDRILTPFLPLGRQLNILSAGCGTGGELRFLQRYGDVVGVDASPEAIRFARLAGFDDTKVKQSPIEQLPFRDRSFDIVFAL